MKKIDKSRGYILNILFFYILCFLFILYYIQEISFPINNNFLQTTHSRH